MKLLLLGMGMGIAGGLIPSPLHLIALTQVALNKWRTALFILTGPLLLVDGILLAVTFFFYHVIPTEVALRMAYVGGTVLILYAIYSLRQVLKRSREELAASTTMTYSGVAAATLGEAFDPGTAVYWLTVAGPILAEGRVQGYWHVVPFFAAGLIAYYGASMLSVWLMARGARLHRTLEQHLLLAANLLVLIMGVSYLLRAHYH